MNLVHLIDHPEALNQETLHELRATVAAHPTHQVARLLMLQNLYLLHDATFDDELRRSALYIADRKVIFNMVEAVHHQINPAGASNQKKTKPETSGNQPSPEAGSQPMPISANMAVTDYTAYMLSQHPQPSEPATAPKNENAKAKRQRQLIDDFTRQAHHSTLPDTPATAQQEARPQEKANAGEPNQGGIFTETLARIYIQQGRYDKALQIIRQLNLNYPEKSRYFADQIRFLEKVIINQQH